MEKQKYDAIVIGAGLGGLSAAGYLAKAGRRVLILEHHTVPGGYAHEFRRGRFRFEVALHALDGAGPGGWAYPILEDLGVFQRVNFRRLDPFYTVKFPEHEITAHGDPFAYEAELIRAFPDEAQGIRALIDAMLAIYWEVRRFISDGELERRPPVEQIPGQFPRMLAAMNESWGEMMARYTSDVQLQAVLSTLWGYYGLPPSQMNAATFVFPWVSYHLFGAHYPEGGSMAMSRALEAELEANGGEIRYRQTVERIEMKGGRAHAVETKSGLRAEADVIVSNASAPTTLLDMLGSEHLPAPYARRVAAAKEMPALSNLVVYLGLERDLHAEGWPHHELFVSPGYDLDGEYQKVLQGQFDRANFVITHYSHVDPGCAPEGNSVLSIFSLAPWDHAGQWGTGGDLAGYSKQPAYLEAKQQAADQLLDAAEEHLPGLRKSIKFMEVGTPLTNYRYSLNPAGSIYGSAQSVDNMYAGRLTEITPVENLFLAGAWAFAGGMSAALLSGRNAARAAIAQLDGTRASYLTGIDLPPTETDLPEEQELAGEVTGELPVGPYQAAVTRREVKLDALGAPAILLLHTAESADQAAAVNRELRQHYPLADQLLVINVVDLGGVPRPFRRIAEGAMRKSFEQAAAALPEGLAPDDYVILLPDWQGALKTFAGFERVDEQVGLLAIDQTGVARGAFQGDPLMETARSLAGQMR